MSMMTLYIPTMEVVEDVVVECVANHETNRDTNIALPPNMLSKCFSYCD